MTGLYDTDIRLDDEWQLTQAADGDAPLCSGLDCLYQNIVLEAITQPGDLFYDPEFGWGLYDFIQSEDSELTRLEITQRARSKLQKREVVLPDSIEISIDFNDDVILLRCSFRFGEESEARNLNVVIGAVMIDKEILDAVIPVPTLEEAKDEKVAELKEEGFVVTNFHSGGVFYTLLMVELRIKIELLQLARRILNNMFVTHAEGVWLDLKMPDYSKKRKKAQKAQGLVTVSRVGASGEGIKIAKGHVFKSILDINGEELRYFTIEAAVLQKGAMSVDVLVEAEAEGSRYNVPEGQITRTLTYIGDVKITNAADWIVREGSDTEDDESARARTLRSWSELAQLATEDAFVNAAESVTGVLFAQADCDHPRGQGTVDIIVTGTAGEATEGLLKSVQEAVDKIAGPYDNILVKSSVTVDQDIELTITTGSADSDEDIENRVKTILTELLAVRRGRKLNELTRSDINFAVRNGYSSATNAEITVPAQDVKLDKDKVITLGAVNVTVERE